MKTKSSQSAFLNLRLLLMFLFVAGVFLALVGVGAFANAFAQAKLAKPEAPTASMADAAPRGHVANTVLWAQSKLFHVPLACDPGAWNTVTTTPQPPTRYRAGGVSDGTFVYVYGGGDSTGALLNDLWRWDPATQTWTQLANMPTGKQNIQGAYWNGKIYVPGGFTTAHITENAIYDIASNTWSTGAPLPTTQTGTNVALNNKVYNFGGNPGPQSLCRVYDIATNSWSSIASMPVATTYGRAALAGNIAYYIGGIAGATTNAVHRYDIAGNSWTTVAPLQTARTSAEVMTSPDSSKLYAIMGGDSSFFTGVPLAQSVEIYNIGTNAWSYGNPVVTKAAAPSGGLAGGKAMVQGGVDGATYYNLVQVSVITSCVPAPQIVAGTSTIQTEGCTPPNGTPDPNETLTVSFCVQNVGTQNTTNLVGTLQATGGVTNPSGPQNYGVVTAGGAAVCRNFTFTATGSCGGTLTATIHFQDGATDLGNVTYTYTLGALVAGFSENFDGVAPPALPANWTADQGTNAAGAPLWQTSNSGLPAPVADTAPNAAFSQDPGGLCDNRLYTPSVMYNAGSQLIFKQNYDLEQASATVAYDAGVLEISINGGAYQDIVAAGGSFVSGGYNHTDINTGFTNPLLPTRPNWSGISNNGAGGFEMCVVNLPASGAGQPVQFRWRMGSDSTVSHNGWRVDTVSIAQRVCCLNATTVTGAVSRKTHGAAGPFDIALPLTGTTGVECRAGGTTNDYTMVVTFAGNVTVTGSPQAQVTSGTGTVGSNGVGNGGAVTVAGNVVTIPLTNVADQQTINVTLNGVNSASFDVPTVNVVIPMSRLLGDSNGNRSVNAGDVSQVKQRIGQAVNATNFRSDLNANGSINAGDVSIAKQNTGHGVP